jgi:hypothetical protein
MASRQHSKHTPFAKNSGTQAWLQHSQKGMAGLAPGKTVKGPQNDTKNTSHAGNRYYDTKQTTQQDTHTPLHARLLDCLLCCILYMCCTFCSMAQSPRHPTSCKRPHTHTHTACCQVHKSPKRRHRVHSPSHSILGMERCQVRWFEVMNHTRHAHTNMLQDMSEHSACSRSGHLPSVVSETCAKSHTASTYALTCQVRTYSTSQPYHSPDQPQKRLQLSAIVADTRTIY